MTDVAPLEHVQGEGSIRVDNLCFGYERDRIFEQVSFQIPRGEIWGLVGRSGVGKTTLLNVVLGLFKPATGTVLVGDAEVRGPGAIKGAIFREGTLLPWLDVLQNVLFPGTDGDLEHESNRAMQLLAEAGLGNSASLLPKQLSQGMAKRVEIVRALMLDRDHFVADEPFSGLDVSTRLDLYQLWKRLNGSHRRTGILCTHDPAEAAALCDAVLIMRKDGNNSATVESVRTPKSFAYRDNAFGLSDPFVRSLVERIG